MALRVKNVLPMRYLCYQCVTTW